MTVLASTGWDIVYTWGQLSKLISHVSAEKAKLWWGQKYYAELHVIGCEDEDAETEGIARRKNGGTKHTESEWE